jgi:hypothetical protein
MKNILLISILFLIGCDIVMVVKPDLVKDGKEYVVRTVCVQSHTESKYEYHYGYNFMNGKYDWHWGLNTVDVCDKSVFDTVEVNLKKKYYVKK